MNERAVPDPNGAGALVLALSRQIMLRDASLAEDVATTEGLTGPL
jgi:hypothetical protein